MKWPIFLYGGAIAALSFALAWLDFRHVTHFYSTEIYILIVAIIFVALGFWVGNKLTPKNPTTNFEQNEKAIKYLGISERELEVMVALSDGASNKVIARKLEISPNTVKTHLAKLFEKLGAQNRTEATNKARELQIIP